MTDEILTLRVEDQSSAAADAATAALDKYGATAEGSEVKLSRLSRTSQQLVNRYDDLTKAENRLARAEAELAAAREGFAHDTDGTKIKADQAQRALEALAAKVAGLRRAYEELKSTTAGGDGTGVAGQAHDIEQVSAALAAYGNTLAKARAAVQGLKDEVYPVAAAYRAHWEEVQRLNALEQAHEITEIELTALTAKRTAGLKAQIAELDGSAAAERRAADAAKVAARAEAELTDQTRAFIAVADPAAAAQARFAEKVALADKLLASGRITQSQYAAGLRAFSGEAERAQASVAGATGVVRQFGIQSIDVFQQLASGAPVMATLVQQGGQIAQVAAVSGGGLAAFGTAGKAALAALVSPAGLAVTALTATAAAVGYLAVAGESAEQRLRALQATLRATRTDAEAMAGIASRAARGATITGVGIGLDDARTAANAFAAQPSFVGSQAQLESLVKTANDLATRIGITLPEAAAKLAQGMRDPAALAGELKGKLEAVDAEFVKSVALQARAGDAAGAYAKILRLVTDETRNAAEETQTKLTKAWDGLKRELIAATDDSSTLGGALVGAMAWYVNYLETLVRLTKAAADAIKSALPGGPTSPLPGSQAGNTSSIPVTPEPRLPVAVSNQIYSIAEQRNFGGSANVSALQADFATRIAYQESRGDQSRVSSAGASGIMGLMPATAAGLGVNPADAGDNITGGLKYIAELWGKYGGNPGLVAMAYNWGPGKLDAFLKGARDIASVPKETQNYVLAVAGVDVAGALSAGGFSIGAAVTGARANSAAATAVGVADDPLRKVDRALADANAGGNSAKSREEAIADIQKYSEALQILAARGETTGANVGRLREALAAAGKAASDAIPPAAKLSREIDDHRKATDTLTAAYRDGREAVAQATIDLKAEEAARGVAGRGTVEFIAVRATLAESYRKETESLANLDLARKSLENNEQVTLIQAEAAALGMSDEARVAYVAGLRAEYAAKRENQGASAEAIDGYKASAVAVAEATAALERNKAALAEVSNFAESVGTNLANGISQAFLQGSGAAVNFANIAKAALTQVANEAIKVAVLNPIMNATLGGTHRTTLTDMLGAVSAGPAASGGGSADGSGGLMNQASNALTLGSLGDKLGLTNIKSLFSGIGDSIYGPTSFLNSVLTTGINGTTLATATNAAISQIPAAAGEAVAGAAVQGPATASAVAGLQGGATIGQFAGGVGAGFGLGSMAGGFVQNSLGKVGPAPMIGAGGGAIAGAALGSIIPGIGTMIGGIIGGLIGGGGGGLIGPKAASAFSSTGVAVDATGMLSVGDTVSQIADPAQEVAALRSDVATLNALLSTSGAKVATVGQVTQIGQNTPGETPDPTKAANLAGAFSGLRFTSNDPVKAAAIADKSFATVEELAKALEAVTASAAETTAFLDQTTPALLAAAKTNSDFAEQIATVQGRYSDAIEQARTMAAQAGQPADKVDQLNTAAADLAAARDTVTTRAIDSALSSLVPEQDGALPAQVAAIAKQYGEAIEAVRQALAANDNSAVVTDRLTKAEADLMATRDKATKAANDAVTESGRASERALLVRTLTAQAEVGGEPSRVQAIKGMGLGEQQRLESLNFAQQLVATFGEAFRETEDFAQRTAAMDQAHYAERLLFQKQFNDQSAANDRARIAQIYSLQSRQATAEAAVSGDPARVQAAALQAFDERARLERESTAAQEVATYGEAFRATQAYADMATQVDRTLYAERLAIQKQYADQATAQEKAAADKAAGLISNLADFAVQLQTGPQSALSAQDQYGVARAAFETTRDKARTGDADALAGVQGAVNTLLTASRALNGSGIAYARDFNEALSAVQDFGQMAPETLTAGVFVAETRSSADRVVAALAELRGVPVAAANVPAGNVIPFPTVAASTEPLTVRLDAGDLLTRATFVSTMDNVATRIVTALRDVQDEIKRGTSDARTRTLLPARMTG